MKLVIGYEYTPGFFDGEDLQLSDSVVIRPASAVAYERATGRVPAAGLVYLSGITYYALQAADRLPTIDGERPTFDQWLEGLESIGEADPALTSDALDPTNLPPGNAGL